VDDAVLVGFGERREDLTCDVARHRDREVAVLLQVVPEARALDELHREEEDALLLVEVEDLDRVRVVELAGRDALAVEARSEILLWFLSS
jgi:hypothetical protein